MTPEEQAAVKKAAVKKEPEDRTALEAVAFDYYTECEKRAGLPPGAIHSVWRKPYPRPPHEGRKTSGPWAKQRQSSEVIE